MDLKSIRKELAGLLTAESEADVFPELALTLYFFTHTLYRELAKSGAGDIFFLSREGQPLLEMFREYSQSMAEKTGTVIRAHYLEVSRRSTLLPSLSSLESEGFDTLFRQYRAISLHEFLSSLGLEAYSEKLGEMLQIDAATLKARVPDLPSDDNFVRLMNSDDFQAIYEKERTYRRAAFLSYLSALAPERDPNKIALVDVGWKGTIQDNLFRLFNLETVATAEIDGYYMGLVAEGTRSEHNRKRGLVFSCIGGRSPHFPIFNENRALYEIMLAADHGSIVSYAFDESGKAFPVRGKFDEEKMIREKIWPVRNLIMRRFSRLLNLPALANVSDKELVNIVAEFHARMVFSPNMSERGWFDSVFHVENFGVFENTSFESSHAAPGFFGKMRFCIEVFRKKGKAPLGFWPYKTILEKGGYLAASAYRYARRAAC
jgi:hypothetical protein